MLGIGMDIGAAQKVDPSDLWSDYCATRELSVRLAENLSGEDQTIQSMPDASPTKWHLAHTSWFFETFILEKYFRGYSAFNPRYRTLFNSYYNQVGEQYSRANRGLISRPGSGEVLDYRQHVDSRIGELLIEGQSREQEWERDDILALLVLGINHEQQHQELILTDIKHALSHNPLNPAYCSWSEEIGSQIRSTLVEPEWDTFDAGIYQIGFDGEDFHFDNEAPRHRVFQESFQIAKRAATNQDYLEFVEDGGYENPSHWLSEGWAWVQEQNVTQPLYWSERDGQRETFTLGGRRLLVAAEPVIHLSYYEADAFARWAGYRLPTEQEWEVAAAKDQSSGEFLDPDRCHPGAANNSYLGDVWCWTSSSYSAYPGFKVAEGAVGEYNGKFMCNQYVLRGGSCVTPQGHIRPTYRNFFPAHARWQFSGVRFAKDA